MSAEVDARTERAARIISSLITGRADTYAIPNRTVAGQAQRAEHPVTRDLWVDHVTSGTRIGIYPLVPDDNGEWHVRWVCVDIDRKENPAQALDLGMQLLETARTKFQLPMQLELTRSRCIHAWLFFRQSVEAWKARAALREILAHADLEPGHERKGEEIVIYPRQDKPDRPKAIGSMVWAPWHGPLAAQGVTVFLDPDTRQPWLDQLDAAESFPLIEASDIDALVETAGLIPENVARLNDQPSGMRGHLSEVEKCPAGDQAALTNNEFRELCHKLPALRRLADDPKAATYDEWLAGMVHLAPFADGRLRAHELSSLDSSRYSAPACDLQYTAALGTYDQQYGARVSHKLVHHWRGGGRVDIIPISRKYCIYRGGFATRKRILNEAGVWVEQEPEKFTNFVAEILSEQVIDDGQSSDGIATFRMSGTLDTGEKLATVEIQSKKWSYVSEWLPERWGFKPMIHPGRGTRDSFLEALALQGQDVPTMRIFTHTGWAKYDGGLVFLTPNGPIGCSEDTKLRFARGARVQLPPALDTYDVPDPEGDDDGANIYRWLEELMDLGGSGGHAVMIPLVSAFFLAPLYEFLPIDFGFFLTGPTGTHKSSLAAAFLSFWGKRFTKNNLPATFRSSALGIERIGFAAKDMPLVVDNYVPTMKGDQQGLAQRLAHGIGDRAGRAKLTRDSRLMSGQAIRALCILTGEDVPEGGSTAARYYQLPMRHDSLRLSSLTELQRAGAEGKLTRATRYYIRWLTGKLTADREGFIDRIMAAWAEEARGPARTAQAHDRMVDQIAWLRVGMELGRQSSPAGWSAWVEQAMDRAFLESADAQGAINREASVAHRFLSAVLYVVRTGRMLVVDATSEKIPDEEPGLFGWKRIESGHHLQTKHPDGQVMGWVDRSRSVPGSWWLCLSPSCVTLVKETFRVAHAIPESARGIVNGLVSAGLMQKSTVDRISVGQDARPWVWKIHGPSMLKYLGVAGGRSDHGMDN